MSDATLLHRFPNMVTNNRLSKLYFELVTELYHDMVGALCPQREILRDLNEIQSRLAQEGLSFLTKTLPRLGKAVDRALAHGDQFNYSGFKKAKGTQLPQFMRTLLDWLFTPDGYPWELHTHGIQISNEIGTRRETRECSDTLQGFHPRNADAFIDRFSRRATSKGWTLVRESGQLGHPTRCVAEGDVLSPRGVQIKALRAVRQLCLFCYKLELPYTEKDANKVISDFVDTDRELPTKPEMDSRKKSDPQFGWITNEARKIIARVLCNVDPRKGIPKHGPGAVATGERPSQKHHFKRYYRRLAAFFNYDEWFFLNHRHLCDDLSVMRGLKSEEFGTAKVVLVPKDSRGPRLISCEPLEYQWVQQGLMHQLVDALESHPLTRGHVNFSDQSINGGLALQGSDPDQGYPWVTLDMKEASDRVSWILVEDLFPQVWVDAIWASRTPQTRLPDGRVQKLRKCSPMGSAVCFPIEALVFYALAVATLMSTGIHSLHDATTNVYVYGDDIICRPDHYRMIANTYQAYGLKLNADKCCVYGPFKESCGVDAFYGHRVTPVRMRAPLTMSRKPSQLASMVALSNHLWSIGAYRSADYLKQHIESEWTLRLNPKSKRLTCMVPTLNEAGGVIAFIREGVGLHMSNSLCKFRFNAVLQRREVHGLRSDQLSEMTELDGWSQVLRRIRKSETQDVNETRVAHMTQVMPRDSGSKTPTGTYPVAHRNRLIRAWTPARG